jgi:hypothetical protein
VKILSVSQEKFSIVDDDMFEYLSQWKWTYSGGYAYRLKTIKGKSKKIWLHREVNGTKDGAFIGKGAAKSGGPLLVTMEKEPQLECMTILLMRPMRTMNTQKNFMGSLRGLIL